MYGHSGVRTAKISRFFFWEEIRCVGLQQQPVKGNVAADLGERTRPVKADQWCQAQAQVRECVEPLLGLSPVPREAVTVNQVVLWHQLFEDVDGVLGRVP